MENTQKVTMETSLEAINYLVGLNFWDSWRRDHLQITPRKGRLAAVFCDPSVVFFQVSCRPTPPRRLIRDFLSVLNSSGLLVAATNNYCFKDRVFCGSMDIEKADVPADIGEYAFKQSRVCWYVSKMEIEANSPSRKDGIDLKKESYLRNLYCSFIQDLGAKIRVPQVTIATAIMFCHRFYLHQSHKKNDCLQVFEKQKSLMLIGERLLLSTICFDVNVELPYGPLAEAFTKFGSCWDGVMKTAWNLVNYWLRTTLCLQYKPHYIAAGSLYLAAKRHGVKLPSANGYVWWHEFEVAPRQLHEVIREMNELVNCNKNPTKNLHKPVQICMSAQAVDAHNNKKTGSADPQKLVQIHLPADEEDDSSSPSPAFLAFQVLLKAASAMFRICKRFSRTTFLRIQNLEGNLGNKTCNGE
ncbi:hypothetical protein HPP92_021218 [Vanilla planifolia]|uniref:Uncharacterized protein n=1 Tax=Vanilla planifolia TaxID=51239 RepID=A0A835UIB7_VANPL|nr:hypothetical protein HPP92_021218 [Vanilla planifolia]